MSGLNHPLVLNGFAVDPVIATLMSRADWAGKRTSKPWLDRFPSHPDAIHGGIRFVEFCAPEWAARENSGVRDPRIALINGKPGLEFPPGDFDPTAGYLIGFTDFCDAGICVDLRPSGRPRLIYSSLKNGEDHYATAFASIDDFVEFYLMQHDC